MNVQLNEMNGWIIGWMNIFIDIFITQCVYG
jgi:hypothetical protein